MTEEIQWYASLFRYNLNHFLSKVGSFSINCLIYKGEMKNIFKN